MEVVQVDEILEGIAATRASLAENPIKSHALELRIISDVWEALNNWMLAVMVKRKGL
eukprot:CAMPEP_0118996988 /NCGR_PEP_ID=MMETSP1173-20130426/61024_1 /TAXON_ID=1034831 /ORGANISM="Rhizochromulina marina cf, Strain CCMP1243" /LENGTH=56 /DNA_ID=CAMNT_0006948401 /DNA_START=81 /DNA_END=248 /DNA_ORIENTATION=-